MKVYAFLRVPFISNKGYIQAVVEWKTGSMDFRHNCLPFHAHCAHLGYNSVVLAFLSLNSSCVITSIGRLVCTKSLYALVSRNQDTWIFCLGASSFENVGAQSGPLNRKSVE